MRTYDTGLQMLDGSAFNQIINMLANGANGLTAHAGGGQASALQLLAGLNEIDTCANDHDSVKLPSAKRDTNNSPTIVMVFNNTAHTLDIYPTSTDQIAGGGADVVFSVATKKSAIFFCAKNGSWGAILSA